DLADTLSSQTVEVADFLEGFPSLEHGRHGVGAVVVYLVLGGMFEPDAMIPAIPRDGLVGEQHFVSHFLPRKAGRGQFPHARYATVLEAAHTSAPCGARLRASHSNVTPLIFFALAASTTFA